MNEKHYEKHISLKHTGSYKRTDTLLRISLFTLLLTIGLLSASAHSVVMDSTEVIFPQSKSLLNPNLGNNRINLDRMVKILKERSDSTEVYQLRNIRVIGAASPEGSVEINRILSNKRAHNIFDYLSKTVSLDNSLTEFVFLGRDWNGLYSLVLEDQGIPFRSEVLDILTPVIHADSVTPEESDRLLRQLKQLHKGGPYRYLYSKIFPRLRNSRLSVEYERLMPEVVKEDSIPADITPAVTDTIILIENVFIDEPTIASASCRPFYMGVKTNLLYDAMLLPNIGAEFYIGKNWTIVGNWTYGWWDKNKTHWYWRAYGGDLAVRKWLGSKAKEKPMTGHHLGIYAGVLTYDFELGGTGYMGGRPGHDLWNRCLYTAGIEYGYSLPIARRLNLDFTIGVGYIGGKIVKYHPKGDKYVWDSTRNFNGILPTKLEVSLVWLIGCGNHN